MIKNTIKESFKAALDTNVNVWIYLFAYNAILLLSDKCFKSIFSIASIAGLFVITFILVLIMNIFFKKGITITLKRKN